MLEHNSCGAELTLPFPQRIRVPIKAMFLFDVNPLVLSRGAVDFCAGSVSPVKLLSSIARSIASNILTSAGTLSPIFK